MRPEKHVTRIAEEWPHEISGQMKQLQPSSERYAKETRCIEERVLGKGGMISWLCAYSECCGYLTKIFQFKNFLKANTSGIHKKTIQHIMINFMCAWM